MEFEMQVASLDLKTAAKIHDDESLDLTFRDLSFTTGKGKPFSCASLCYSILIAANSTPRYTVTDDAKEVHFTVRFLLRMCSANPQSNQILCYVIQPCNNDTCL